MERFGHRLDLFEPSNEDTQILNQYASTNPYHYEKPEGELEPRSDPNFS